MSVPFLVRAPLARLKLLCALAVALAGVACYSNTFRAPFVFDDDSSIVQNAAIRPPLSLASLWTLQPTRFVGHLSFALNYRWGQLRVGGYHAVNTMVHMLASLCVWWLLLLLLRTPVLEGEGIAPRTQVWLAFFGALVFAVHPVQTQAVTYIVQRFTSLAALWYIAAAAGYCEFRLNAGRRRWAWLGLSAASGLLALLTKENAFSLPVMIGLIELFFFGDGRQTWKRPAAVLAALAAAALALAALDLLPRETTAISRPQYLFTQGRVLLTYLRLLAAPVGQRVDYDYPIYSQVLAPPVLAGCAAAASLVALALAWFERRRLLSFAVVWFLVALAVESSLMPIRDVIFEHRLYLPMAGYALFLVGVIAYYGRALRARLVIAIAAALILCFGLSTYMRNEIWRSKLRILNDTVVHAPRKARPVDYRGTFWESIGWNQMAFDDYTRAIELDSTYWKASYHRGSLLARSARERAALPDLRRAIRLAPDYPPSYINAGNALLGLGLADSAIFCYNEALSLDTASAGAYGNRGLAFVRKGETGQGLGDYNRALALDTALQYVRLDRGLALNAMREYDQAIPDFDHYLSAFPQNTEALAGRAWALFRLRRYREAERDYRRAVVLKAVLPRAYAPMAEYFAARLAE